MALESVREVTVAAKSGSPDELRTRDELRELLADHDLTGLQWTAQVVVESWVVPHSHPILTLNTRTSGDELLATYLHEQLHWWLDACSGLTGAVEATRSAWPRAPDRSAGGAKDEQSTREHLILCRLEHRALLEVIGEERAATTLRRRLDGPVYPWIYAQTASRGPVLDEICTTHDVWPPRLARS